VEKVNIYIYIKKKKIHSLRIILFEVPVSVIFISSTSTSEQYTLTL